jgi:hypothetical protein
MQTIAIDMCMHLPALVLCYFFLLFSRVHQTYRYIRPSCPTIPFKRTVLCEVRPTNQIREEGGGADTVGRRSDDILMKFPNEKHISK